MQTVTRPFEETIKYLYDELDWLGLMRERCQQTDGPADLALALTDTDDYPELDTDTDANYLLGMLDGIAASYNLTRIDLLKALLEYEKLAIQKDI